MALSSSRVQLARLRRRVEYSGLSLKKRARRWVLHLFAIAICMLSAVNVSYRTLPRFVDESEVYRRSTSRKDLVEWPDRRCKTFASRWTQLQLRNLAVYSCVATRKMTVLNTVLYYALGCPDTYYHEKFDELFDVPSLCISHDCLSKFGKSHFVYSSFVLHSYEVVTGFKLCPPAPVPNGMIAVIVEPRRNPLLEFTVKQVMSTVGASWALQIFVSDENEGYVRSIFDVTEGGLGQNIVITNLAQFGLDDMGHMGNRVQSAFSAHNILYRTIPSEHILWFQVDVVLRREIPADWLRYAYVGSEWEGCQHPFCSPQTCTSVCSGGNSGLSLRRRSKLLLVATKGELPQDLWGIEVNNPAVHKTDFATPRRFFESDELHDNSVDRWFEDDLQISYKLSKLGLLPPGDILPHFALGQALPAEGIEAANPVGLHKPWMTPWISPQTIIDLLKVVAFSVTDSKQLATPSR